MIHIKRTLLAVMLSGTALVGHAAALSNGTNAQVDLSFAKKTGTTNELNAQHNLPSGESLTNGQVLAEGTVTSIYDPEIFEVDLDNTNTRLIPGTYNGHHILAIRVPGKNNPDKNSLDIALEAGTVNDKVAANYYYGVVLNDTASQSAQYNIISMTRNNNPQTVPADTYTVKTTSYVWAE